MTTERRLLTSISLVWKDWTGLGMKTLNHDWFSSTATYKAKCFTAKVLSSQTLPEQDKRKSSHYLPDAWNQHLDFLTKQKIMNLYS